jgi:hypothetical protein
VRSDRSGEQFLLDKFKKTDIIGDLNVSRMLRVRKVKRGGQALPRV